MNIRSMREMDLHHKKVLLRLDINSPIDPKTGRIVNDNRIRKSVPTLRYLLEQEAAVAVIAHQGDTLDYQNLIPLVEHAERLTALLGREVRYIDDVCGPAAQESVRSLSSGEIVILGNVRYLTEEVSSFEDNVPLQAAQMKDTWIVRGLAPLFDAYVNDAFAAAHRNAPSMVAFQRLLPSGAGTLFFDEVSALSKVMREPPRPAVFLLGGAKISDAFGMMEEVLRNGSADRILTTGVTGLVFLRAAGYALGDATDAFLAERSLNRFVDAAARYLADYPGKIEYPRDLAYPGPESAGGAMAGHGAPPADDGVSADGGAATDGAAGISSRREMSIDELPGSTLYPDIGAATIAHYRDIIARAGTIFVNGPAGRFEDPTWEIGTRELWNAVADASGYSVVGGGDSVSAVHRFVSPEQIDYICTAGGAMVRFLSGKRLPLIQAMEDAVTGEKNI